MNYKIEIAGCELSYSFIDESIAWYFGSQMQRTNDSASCTIRITETELADFLKNHCYSPQYSEFFLCMNKTSNVLLAFNRVIFHAVALCDGPDGYLIAGPSGVGKSTQYFNLKELNPESIEIINGDKPVLEFQKDKIMIHPSPWKGKEELGSDKSAPLKGIIFLEQNHHNTISRIKPDQAVILCLRQFLYTANTTDAIQIVCKMCRRLLNEIPIWYFENDGTLESSKLLYKSVILDNNGNSQIDSLIEKEI